MLHGTVNIMLPEIMETRVYPYSTREILCDFNMLYKHALCTLHGMRLDDFVRFFSCYITASFMRSPHWFIQLTSWLKSSTQMHSEGRLSLRLCPSEPLQQSGRRSVTLGSSCMMGNCSPSAAELYWQRSSLHNCCVQMIHTLKHLLDAVLLFRLA